MSAEEVHNVYCKMPIVPERTFRLGFPPDVGRLIMTMGDKWVNGTVLTYCFLDKPKTLAGGEREKKIVREGFDVWKNVGIGIKCEEVKTPEEAKIRIGFKQNDGYWSFVGREILNTHYNCLSCGIGPFTPYANTPACPNCRSKDLEEETRTMNIDKSIRYDPRGKDVPTHEIGHTLGFPHEHQSPIGGIVWNEEAVYDYFARPPNNWPRAVTEWNIIRKINPDEVEASGWDPDSIMHYEFKAGLILKPEKYQTVPLEPAAGLSARDKQWVKHWYPPALDYEEIKLDQPVLLNLKPGDQKSLYFIPPETRAYDFQTSGESDTVMVLFEEVNGQNRQLDADDDSGEHWNAHIREDLTKGNKYILNIRLYWNWKEGDTTVNVR